MKKPEILILDDSSSALDFRTDALLRKAIAGLGGGMTVIIISQRVNTVRGTDRIVVMDDGRIAACAPHDKLLRSCEIYREICTSQEVDA